MMAQKHKLSWHRKHKVSWPALKHCKLKCDLLTQMKNDRLSELPDDILLSIMTMASFTTKEAARTSLLSHRWKNLWRCYPILRFGFPWEGLLWSVSCQAICKFVEEVDHAVEGYLGSSVDEFNVTFHLDNAYQSHIDKWMAFALAKQVKRLELNFRPHCGPKGLGLYTLPLECCAHLGGFKSSLMTSLRLEYVNIASEVVECFLRSCPRLENLCIRGSETLTSIRAPDSLLLRLTNLEICSCRYLETIDIVAPKLLSFKYVGGDRISMMHIRNAFSLAHVSVGNSQTSDRLRFFGDSLSVYLSQLECLKLNVCLWDKFNLGTNQVPALSNLKHLELFCSGYSMDSVLAFVSLIEASPVLQKLTLKLRLADKTSSRIIAKHKGRPLKRLKTFEIFGFVGCPIDLEFLTYVLKNAIVLQEVIVDARPMCSSRPDKRAQRRILRLEKRLPPDVKLIWKQGGTWGLN